MSFWIFESRICAVQPFMNELLIYVMINDFNYLSPAVIAKMAADADTAFIKSTYQV